MLKDKRVLVVEDEPALRAAVARLVREEGCLDVLEAGSLRAARELLPRLPAVIIMDVVLPDGDAIGLVQEAADIRPAPIIVAMSGRASA
ncbi:MAG: response regulator, partial [Myxococcales bacterium]|nr:response regulator [Myxococcales bacterium]